MTQHLSDADVHDGRTAPADAVSPPRVLAIGAHPGDIFIGAGATLLSHHASRHQIDVVTMAGDEIGQPDGPAAALLDTSSTTGGFLACTIGSDGASVTFLEHVIDLIAPDVIYTHSGNDHDPDHRNTNRAVLAAAGAVPSIYCFEIPATASGFAPARYVDVDDHLSAKLRLLAEHPARTACANIHPHVVTRTARHWAGLGASTYAEALEVEREATPVRSPGGHHADVRTPVMV